MWPGKIPDHSVCSVCTLFLFKSLSWKHGALQQVRAFVDLPILAGMWQEVPGRALSRAMCKRGRGLLVSRAWKAGLGSSPSNLIL